MAIAIDYNGVVGAIISPSIATCSAYAMSLGPEANEGRVRMIGSGEAAARTRTKIPTKWAVLPRKREVHTTRLSSATPISGLDGRDPAE